MAGEQSCFQTVNPETRSHVDAPPTFSRRGGRGEGHFVVVFVLISENRRDSAWELCFFEFLHRSARERLMQNSCNENFD